MKKIAMDVPSGTYGYVLWPEEGSATDFAFGSFSSWIPRRLVL
jgi:hypothetical protein